MIDDGKRALLAKDLLDNEVLSMALGTLEHEVIEAWEKCPARDQEGKEELWRLYKTAKKFRGILVGYVQAGKLPRIQDASIMQRAVNAVKGKS